MKKFLIVNKNDFFKKKIKNNNKSKFYFISNNKHLTINKIKKINPNIIFFPHWSWIISEKILKEYLCIGFHSTPLPYGRGGSPIQNMILRGFKKTSICAFKIEKTLDSGPLFMKKKLMLKNSGHMIFKKMYEEITMMIKKICIKLPSKKPQKGKAVYFNRLKKQDGLIKSEYSIDKIYNLIRSLDMKDENYTPAYIKLNNLKIYFTNAEIKKRRIFAKIILKRF